MGLHSAHKEVGLYLLIEGICEQLQPGRVEGGQGKGPHCSDVSIHM